MSASCFILKSSVYSVNLGYILADTATVMTYTVIGSESSCHGCCIGDILGYTHTLLSFKTASFVHLLSAVMRKFCSRQA